MIVGFTGTRRDLTLQQEDKVEDILTQLKPTVLHHGSCVGADARTHFIAKRLGMKVIIHPPTNTSQMARLLADEYRDPKPYLERNHNIVDESFLLIAAPGQVDEVRRSGTWATIRYARKQGKTVLLVLPEE